MISLSERSRLIRDGETAPLCETKSDVLFMSAPFLPSLTTEGWSVMTRGGITAGLNHVGKQKARAGYVSGSERIPL